MTEVRLSDTATRQVKKLSPIKRGQVSLYTCGPTVYDHPHIGNWRSFIFDDTLRRSIKATGYKIKQVMNITDVGHLTDDADEGEDKLAKAARQTRQTTWEIAETYLQEFKAGMELLNIEQPEFMPRATEHIKQQIDLIKKLEERSHTYQTSDGVYYDISTFPAYGKMAGLDLKGLKAGARVRLNDEKRHPADFALWKLTPKGTKRDMEWESPWGRGFPGWHLECSAMAIEYLGPAIDIHTGGIDHIPIHHTNEIAQSEGATGKKFANLWIHNEFITVEGHKMSKSLGNYFTLQDLAKKGFEPLALRTLYLQSHYKTPINFTWDGLKAAQTFLQNTLRPLADLVLQSQSSGANLPADKKFNQNLVGYLADDLKSASALAALAGLAEQTPILNKMGADRLHELLEVADALLGLGLSTRKDINNKQKELIAQRQKSKDADDFAAADDLREELKKQDLGLRDTPQGTTWYRLTPPKLPTN